MPSYTWTMFGCRASLSSEPLSNARQPSCELRDGKREEQNNRTWQSSTLVRST